MVIINKKRIQIIISALLVGIFTFSLQIANNNQKGEKNKNQNNEILELQERVDKAMCQEKR